MNLLPNILIFIAALLAVFGQSTFNGLRHLLGAQIDLLPALMVYTALTASPAMMLTLAVTGGLLFDTLSANPLGYKRGAIADRGFPDSMAARLAVART